MFNLLKKLIGNSQGSKNESSMREKEHAAGAAMRRAVDLSMAVIEFDMAGNILNANANFLAALGYSLEEIRGQHHRMFVDTQYATSRDYESFWAELRSGIHKTGEFPRIANGGKKIWIQASYTPVIDEEGEQIGVIKFATDITQQKETSIDQAAQIQSLNISQAVIEFDMQGNILTANDNFLACMGYQLTEINGKHHSMFAEEGYARSAEYAQFWEKLRSGEFDSGEYRRLAKGGREVWIRATYNPVKDENGKPFKVVKFATDITKERLLQVSTEHLLEDALLVMGGVEKGDLSGRMQAHDAGDLGALSDAINNCTVKLEEIIGQIICDAGVINTESGKLTEGAQDLAKRSEEQAANLEETAASLEELTATVRKNARSAESAQDMAGSSREQAVSSIEIMEKAIDAMSAIGDASDEISSIIGVIDEIAFQTNLLALNASVEAARAGTHGQGFSVVASEVRALAGKSADAAKQIKQLIQGSVSKIEDGSNLVKQSGDSLKTVVSGVEDITNIISEIAEASKDQALSVEQVNQAVMQIDRITQDNVQLVSDTTRSSQMVGHQLAELMAIASYFKSTAGNEQPSADRYSNAA